MMTFLKVHYSSNTSWFSESINYYKFIFYGSKVKIQSTEAKTLKFEDIFDDKICSREFSNYKIFI